jgi:nitrite reductase/ring-hydroxylating ferredoxin subunit
MLPVKLPNGDRIVVIRCGGTVSALADQCTHQAMPLSAGELLPDGTIECPWHGARFDRASGACREGPATDPVVSYAVSIEGDQVTIGDRQRAPA